MKVQNGIVTLKSIVPDWRKAIKNNTVIPNDLCGGFYDGYWLNDIEGENYFFKISKKKGFSKELFNQILGEELARMVGIETVHSKVVDVGNHFYGLLSFNYIKYNDEVFSGKSIVLQYLHHLYKDNLLELWLDSCLTKEEKAAFENENLDEMMQVLNAHNLNCNSLNFIWDALYYHFKDFSQGNLITEKIIKNLTQRYIFSFFIMNKDFHLKNWEVLDIHQNYRLSPLYDIDLSFDKSFSDLNKNNSLQSYETDIASIYEDFERYFYSSAESFRVEVYHQKEVLKPENVQAALDNILSIYQDPKLNSYADAIMTNYVSHYEQINAITKERTL